MLRWFYFSLVQEHVPYHYIGTWHKKLDFQNAHYFHKLWSQWLLLLFVPLTTTMQFRTATKYQYISQFVPIWLIPNYHYHPIQMPIDGSFKSSQVSDVLSTRYQYWGNMNSHHCISSWFLSNCYISNPCSNKTYQTCRHLLQVLPRTFNGV